MARDFLADAVARNGTEPHTIHADRGGAIPLGTAAGHPGHLWVGGLLVAVALLIAFPFLATITAARSTEPLR